MTAESIEASVARRAARMTDADLAAKNEARADAELARQDRVREARLEQDEAFRADLDRIRSATFADLWDDSHERAMEAKTNA